ncbi:hypothetical protein KUV26_22375 [Leisingera daeponensis]|uniref:Uncharacterized protein n=1 Tax=Leisingera daeponensis TaxID=405746 RepID=A0ABS7NLW8_9RHOB|nr:hypothetical protein [Leisingera daeponensis]MBY6142184.1 hypothetical protein [Leisingera daeponensis]
MTVEEVDENYVSRRAASIAATLIFFISIKASNARFASVPFSLLQLWRSERTVGNPPVTVALKDWFGEILPVAGMPLMRVGSRSSAFCTCICCKRATPESPAQEPLGQANGLCLVDQPFTPVAANLRHEPIGEV